MTPPVVDRLRAAGVIAVLRAPTAAAALPAIDALVAGGIEAIEVTYSTPDVPAVLAAVTDRHGDRLVLGAGTLRHPAQAAEAAAAGAQFLVSPGTEPALAHAMAATGVAAIVGALTPTEVMRAEQLPVDAIKLFPGSLGGPAYLRALRGPFPDLAFVPTGGVAADNLADWFAAGALAVGAGGELCSSADIAAGRTATIQANAESFISALRAARERRPDPAAALP